MKYIEFGSRVIIFMVVATVVFSFSRWFSQEVVGPRPGPQDAMAVAIMNTCLFSVWLLASNLLSTLASTILHRHTRPAPVAPRSNLAA